MPLPAARPPLGLATLGAGRPRLTARRAGSVAMIAMSVLFVLGVVIFSLSWVSGTTFKLSYHAYYNEKAQGLSEGVHSIARNVAQTQLSQLLEAPGTWVDITNEVEGVATSMRLWEADDSLQPTVTVEARVRDDAINHFAKDEAYTTVQESKAESGLFAAGNEIEGKVEIRTSLSFDLVGPENFKVPPKTTIAEYEFKRISRTPRLLRQFVLFVKQASAPDDAHEKYEGASGYNRVSGTMAGDANQGALFLAPQGANPADPSSLAMPRANGNPFQTNIGYVYLGGDTPIYLNLAAGNDQSDYSEVFHLYKGESTNFYKLWSTDFTSFVEQAKSGTDKKGGGILGGIGRAISAATDWIKSLFNKMKDLVNVIDRLDQLGLENPSLKNDLPLYYIVRKDYGYATEWGQDRFRSFGFTGAPVHSSTLHLYGSQQPQTLMPGGAAADGAATYSGGSWGPTLVLGKVYRRVLSLAGYKARRGDSDPTADRRLEVQAGPIEHFKDLDQLLKRKMDPRKSGEEAPIWVWDNRVDWYRESNPDAAGNGSTGTYIPISGYGLVGRILPALPGFQKNEADGKMKELWTHSLLPPREIFADSDVENIEQAAEAVSQFNQANDFPEHIKGGISPLIMRLYKKGYFNRIRPTPGFVAAENSPYTEEILRNFAYASSMSQAEFERARTAVVPTVGGVPRPTDEPTDTDVGMALLTGSAVWNILKMSIPDSQRITPEAIQDAGKRMFWKQSPETPEADRGKYPFSLPDPWSNEPGQVGRIGMGTGGSVDRPRGGGGAAGVLKNNFQKYFDREFGGDKERIFDEYIRPIMTDPGRTLPYNYSMRFIYPQIKNLFQQGEAERAQVISEDVAPEVRDGIGYVIEGRNEYLRAEDDATGEGTKFDRAIDDEVLAAIHQARGSDAYLKKGYFFMDEYGPAVTAPRDIEVMEPYATGRRYCWKELSEDDFRERFGPPRSSDAGRVREISFGNAVQVTGDLGVFDEGPTNVVGGGVILAEGTIKISHSIGSDQPLTIIANRIEIGGDADTVVQAMLVAKELEFTGPVAIEGAVIADTWNLNQGQAPGGRVLLAYRPTLKQTETFLQVIEPRISRLTVTSGAEPP